MRPARAPWCRSSGRAGARPGGALPPPRPLPPGPRGALPGRRVAAAAKKRRKPAGGGGGGGGGGAALGALPERDRQPVRVQATRRGKGGKTVTVITGLRMPPGDVKDLLKRLKATCGAGGKVVEAPANCSGAELEVQGDQAGKVLDLLVAWGFTAAKKSGG